MPSVSHKVDTQATTGYENYYSSLQLYKHGQINLSKLINHTNDMHKML